MNLIIENSELQQAKGGKFDKQDRKLTDSRSETKNVGPGHYIIENDKMKKCFQFGKFGKSPKSFYLID